MATDKPTRVVISGAGPAGLLTAIQFLRRNSKPNGKKYTVDIIDQGVNYGLIDNDGLMSRKRSWMVGLSAHGLNAIREVPGLLEKYFLEFGLKGEGQAIHFGKTVVKMKIDTEVTEGYVFDRNFIVAALSRYLNDEFGEKKSSNFNTHFSCKVLYVDSDNKRVLFRDNSKEETRDTYVDYDLLVGCDGVRSPVREAFVLNHRDFEVISRSASDKFKALHINLDEKLHSNLLHLVFTGSCVFIMIPETENKVNVLVYFEKDGTLDERLLSEDKRKISDFFNVLLAKSAPEIARDIDFDDFAENFINSSWNGNSLVNCNFYHSLKMKAIIMGDAAHATPPNLGQGMNTALADVSVLNHLLDKHNDKLDDVLADFSKERVKEGNALTYLSFYQYPMVLWKLPICILEDCIRGLIAPRFPFLMKGIPIDRLARGEKLSVVYNDTVHSGRLPFVRRATESFLLDKFEREVGMVTDKSGKGFLCLTLMAAIGMCFFAYKNQLLTLQ